MTPSDDDLPDVTPDRPWNVVIADDHPIIQQALARTLKKRLGLRQPVMVETYDELCDAVIDSGDNFLVITDLVMPGMRGLDTLKHVRALAPKASVVVYSSNAGEGLAKSCLDLGVRAFIGKRATEDAIAGAIEAVMEGGTAVELGENPSSIAPVIMDRMALVHQLSPQQTKVFQLLGDGLLNKQIAYKLGISEATVKAHVGKILETLNITSRSQAAIASAWMVEHGLL